MLLLLTGPFTSNISTSIKVYELLFEASRAVNDFYGLNILVRKISIVHISGRRGGDSITASNFQLVVIGCFVHLLVTPYDLYLELRFKNYTFIFPQICWMVSHVLRLLLIVEPCHAATQWVS